MISIEFNRFLNDANTNAIIDWLKVEKTKPILQCIVIAKIERKNRMYRLKILLQKKLFDMIYDFLDCNVILDYIYLYIQTISIGLRGSFQGFLQTWSF